MDLVFVPYGLSFYDFLIFDIGLTLIIETPIVIWLLNYRLSHSSILVLFINGTSLTIAIALGIFPVIPYLSPSNLPSYLSIIGWDRTLAWYSFAWTIITEIALLSAIVLVRNVTRADKKIDMFSWVKCGFIMNLVSWPLLVVSATIIGILSTIFYLTGLSSLFPWVIDGIILLTLSIEFFLLPRIEGDAWRNSVSKTLSRWFTP